MTKVVQAVNVFAVVGSIVVVGALTCGTLLYLVCDLKAAQMNTQCSLIPKFKLGYYTMEATKTICCVNDVGIVDHSNQIIEEISLVVKES